MGESVIHIYKQIETMGFVYCMKLDPDGDKYKIGYTGYNERHTRDQVETGLLSRYSTTNPECIIIGLAEVSDAHKAEKLIHEFLKERRIYKNREIFKIRDSELHCVCNFLKYLEYSLPLFSNVTIQELTLLNLNRREIENYKSLADFYKVYCK
jgi:hypothetical protein